MQSAPRFCPAIIRRALRASATPGSGARASAADAQRAGCWLPADPVPHVPDLPLVLLMHSCSTQAELGAVEGGLACIREGLKELEGRLGAVSATARVVERLQVGVFMDALLGSILPARMVCLAGALSQRSRPDVRFCCTHMPSAGGRCPALPLHGGLPPHLLHAGLQPPAPRPGHGAAAAAVLERRLHGRGSGASMPACLPACRASPWHPCA